MSIEIVMVKTKNLKPAEYNPRLMSKHDADQLAHSMTEFGVVDPIIVNSHPSRNNIIIGGHQRYYIAKQLNYEELPVVYVSIDDIKREKELNVRLNKNVGEWDWEKLANEFDVDFLKDVGFTDKELQAIPADDIEEDTIPEAPKKARAKKGQIYLLGRHRLMCGDSTKKDDVEKMMDGKKADMVFTDPPYGMNLNTDWSGAKSDLDFVREKHTATQGHKYDKVIGDEVDFDPTFIFDLFKCKEIFLWGADYYAERLQNKNEGSWIVWDKRLEESADKMYGSCFELCWSKNKHKREIARIKWAGIFGTEKEPDKDKSRKHPTQKPVDLAVWFIKNFSREKSLIVDIYAGSGFTLIASEKTNRTCYGMEIDPIYCDVIIERYCNLVGADKEEIYGKAER